MTTLKTSRLVLRAPEPGDAEAITAFVSDWDVAGMTSNIPHPYALDDARIWIALDQPDRFVVQLGDQLVGGCGARPADADALEIGYWIGKPYWGGGFMTEAAGALVAYLRQRNSAQRIVVSHVLGNDRSRRVIAKLGFGYTGDRELFAAARGKTVTVAYYELPFPPKATP